MPPDEEEGGRGERGHGCAGVVVQRRDGCIGGGVDPGEREEGEGGDDAAGVDRLEATREAATRTRPSDGDDGRAGEAGLLVEGERRDVVDGRQSVQEAAAMSKRQTSLRGVPEAETPP